MKKKKGEIVHYTHFEELFPYISTIDEISGAMYYYEKKHSKK
jgi:hypothetical protein